MACLQKEKHECRDIFRNSKSSNKKFPTNNKKQKLTTNKLMFGQSFTGDRAIYLLLHLHPSHGSNSVPEWC